MPVDPKRTAVVLIASITFAPGYFELFQHPYGLVEDLNSAATPV